MRLLRRNILLLVYVRATGMKFPIIVPLPLAAVEELCRAATVVAWLVQGGMRGRLVGRSRKEPGGSARKLVSSNRISRLPQLAAALAELFPAGVPVQPWRVITAVRHMVRKLRDYGPFDLVDVETEDARVLVRLM